MKSYDDLQRFKEKTQTNHIEFKDMSEQALNSDGTNWAVIKQLLNDGAGSVLDNSQRIDLAAPQPIDPVTFTAPPPADPVGVTPPLATQSYVATTAAASDSVGASLLDSISASLPSSASAPVPQAAPAVPVTPLAEVDTLRVLPAVQKTPVAGASLLDQLAASTPLQHAAAPVPPVAVPAAAPAPLVAPVAPQRPAVADVQVNTSFKQLFSPSVAPASQALSKDMLLKPLLEKIASCR